MDRFMDFLAMGGYAAYVWPAYGLTIAVLGGFTAQAILRHRAATRALAKAGEAP